MCVSGEVKTTKQHKRRRRPSWANTIILGSLAHGGYLLSLAVLVVVCAPLLLLLFPFPRFRRRVSGAIVFGFLFFFTRVYLPCLRVYRIVEISGLNKARPPKGVVCVANHRSGIDGLLLLPLVRPASVALKPKHARKPGYAALVWLFDFVILSAGSLDGLRKGLAKCRALLAAKNNLLVFPEGSRSSSGRFMPFADFAFRFAFDSQTPILPVLVHSDRPFLNRQKGSYFTREVIEYRIRFLPMIGPMEAPDATALAALVRSRMAAVLSEMDRQFLKPTWEEEDAIDAGFV